MTEAEIRALSRMLDRLDYYKLLRIERTAATPAIHTAYRSMRRGFHPDAYMSHEQDLRVAVGEISKRVNEGYQVLRDSARRAAYDQGLDEGRLRFTAETEEVARSEAAAPGGTTSNGKRCFSEMKTAERSGDLVGAINSIKMALRFEPENEHFKAKLEELQARAPKKKKSANPYTIK
jgi:DnaJ-class molecular chaperone